MCIVIGCAVLFYCLFCVYGLVCLAIVFCCYFGVWFVYFVVYAVICFALGFDLFHVVVFGFIR